MTSIERRIPPELLPQAEQQLVLSLPWDRAVPGDRAAPGDRGSQGEAPRGVTVPPRSSDPIAGLDLGRCVVIGRLSESTAKTYLALRRDDGGTRGLVVLRRLDQPDLSIPHVRAAAQWAQTLNAGAHVRVFTPEETEHGVYWVSELPSGATFAELLQATRRTGQSLPLGLVLGGVLEAARALAELHQKGAAHGLVREQSLLVGFDGTTRLLDTGLIQCVGTGQTWGELAEAMAPTFAPEQLREARPPDPRTDVFSLAALLYEGLTRNPIRRGAKSFEQHAKLALDMQFVPPSKVNMTLPPALDTVMAHALSIDRTQRYPTAKELAAALSDACSAFVWRKDQRAQFVAKHFEARQKEEVSLRSTVAQLPEPQAPAPPEPELTFEALPDEAPPSELMSGLSPMPPALHDVPVPEPIVAPPAPVAAPVPPRSKTVPFAIAAGVLGLMVGGGLSVALHTEPPPPPPPLPPLVWRDDVFEESVVVEQVVASPTCQFEVSEAPAPPLSAQDLETNESRKEKVKKRKRDNVPLPPWLRKRGR